MSGVTKLDRIRNERIRGTMKVGEISKKVQESRLKWYGHGLRREEYVGKRVMVMEVPGKRRRGRPKRRWLDNIQERLVGKRIVKGGSARPSSMEASHKKHRPHMKVGSSFNQVLVAAPRRRTPAKRSVALCLTPSTTTCCTDCVRRPQAHMADSGVPPEFQCVVGRVIIVIRLSVI